MLADSRILLVLLRVRSFDVFDLIRSAWGEGDLPVSRVQDEVDLSVAKMADIKVDKWRMPESLRLRGKECWMRIEFYDEVSEINAAGLPLVEEYVSNKYAPTRYAVLSLDSDQPSADDTALFVLLVRGLIEFAEESWIYAYSEGRPSRYALPSDEFSELKKKLAAAAE